MVLRLAVILIVFSMVAYTQDRSHARSMVITRDGIVATSHVQASVAGAQILAKGGSAMDAAIAANAVLGVIEPMMNGIGGDLFAIYWDAKTGKLYGLNCERMGAAGPDVGAMKAKGATEMPLRGIDAVTVPGRGSGVERSAQALRKIPWSDLLQPAIYYADHGYPVPELIHAFWREASLAR